jgi:imidazolonepropionase-like amidohydrolase
MKRPTATWAIPAFILLFVPFVLLAAVAGPAAAVTVTAARALDVATGKVLPRPLVRIEKGVIVELGTFRPGSPVDIDLGDVTLLPGLIDAHVHLTGGEEVGPEERRRETAARAALEGAVNARRVLESGFTTVRDMGSRDLVDVALRDAIARGRLPGPRMLVAVKGLSATGGHGDDNALPPDIEVHRYSAVADGPEAVRAKVRTNIKYGADWIKMMATGGTTSFGTDLRQCDYTEEELRAGVLAAQEKGRDVAVHAHGSLGILRAARAGARSIEHASMLDDASIAAVRKGGTFLVMNPVTNLIMAERGAGGGYTSYQLQKAREVYTMKLASLKRAVAARLLLAYGTDSGVQAHGSNARQLAIYVAAGMTPLQAIQAATVVNARLLRLEGKVGGLSKGHFGDLIAVRGDPLANIRVLEQPVFVMKDGVVALRR